MEFHSARRAAYTHMERYPKTLSKKRQVTYYVYGIYSYTVCIYIYFIFLYKINLYINICTHVFIHTKKISGRVSKELLTVKSGNGNVSAFSSCIFTLVIYYF